MAPETTTGRWLCIVYAIIGIPLCLITLADLGLSFSKSLKYFYRKARHKYKNKQRTWHIGCSLKHCCTKVIKEDVEEGTSKDVDTDEPGPNLSAKDFQSNNIFNADKSSTFDHVAEESNVSSTSLLLKSHQQKALGSVSEEESDNSQSQYHDHPNIPENNLLAGFKSSNKSQTNFQEQQVSKHSPESSSHQNHKQPHLTDKDKAQAISVVNKLKQSMQSNSTAPMSPALHRMLVNEKATRLIQHSLVGTEDMDNNICMDELDKHSHVPMILPVFITMVYILIGVLIYSQWEGWDFTEAFYYTFISLSTIGFGDFVSTGKYVMISIMYQLLGLALVAMTVTFLMELANATLGKAKYKVDQLAEKKFGFAVAENGITQQKRVPIGIPLKNRKLKTQLSEFI